MIALSTLSVIVVLIIALAAAGKRFSRGLSLKHKNWWLIAHIMFIVIYFSGLFSTLLLTTISTTVITDKAQIHAAHLFSKYCDWFMIIPGAFGSLITGVWLAVRTKWKLTQYYWIVIKTLGHIGAIIFGATLMRIWFDKTAALSALHQTNILQNSAYLYNRQLLIVGTIISIFILTLLVIISIFKPWGKRKKYQTA